MESADNRSGARGLPVCPEWTSWKWSPGTDKFAGSEFGHAPHARGARAMDGPSPSNHRHADFQYNGEPGSARARRRTGRVFASANRTARPDRAYTEPGACLPTEPPRKPKTRNGLAASRPNGVRTAYRAGAAYGNSPTSCATTTASARTELWAGSRQYPPPGPLPASIQSRGKAMAADSAGRRLPPDRRFAPRSPSRVNVVRSRSLCPPGALWQVMIAPGHLVVKGFGSPAHARAKTRATTNGDVPALRDSRRPCPERWPWRAIYWTPTVHTRIVNFRETSRGIINEAP